MRRARVIQPGTAGCCRDPGLQHKSGTFWPGFCFSFLQCLHWASLSCAVLMSGGAYVCFYSSISKGWLQGGACTFPVCLAKKPILESTREPCSPAEHAILMFTKDRVLSKPGKHHGRCQHYFPASGFAWFCFSFCHSVTAQLAYSCTAQVSAL